MTTASVTLRQVELLAFGKGVAGRIGEDLASNGRTSAVIVSTPTVRSHAEAAASAIEAKGARVEIWDDCISEPTVADLERLLSVVRAADADAVIGIGGGSTMDLAKLAAAMSRGSQTIDDVTGTDRVEGRAIWLACVPTTAGTGSEVSPIAIMLDESDLLKKGVVSRHLVPDAAYVDPLLTVSMPPAVTAATGLDALTHCIEAFANRFAHPLIDTFALEGIRLIGRSLLKAIADGTDLEAREDMARASLYGGLCLGPVNTAAVHALAYPLGGEFHIPHGVSNALLLPHVLAFNLPSAIGRYAAIARALGVSGGGSEEDEAHQGLAVIEALCLDCGVPMRMRDHGVSAEALDRMTDAAMTVTRLLERNVREVTWQDTRQIYEAAL